MVETDIVVCAWPVGSRGADEAVVDKEFVVRMCAVGGEDFFANVL